jgi:predicted DsbA family dithiol-disulfide isomerase
VPFYVIDGRYGVSGAQPPDVLARALRAAAGDGRRTEAAASAACGPDGCD